MSKHPKQVYFLENGQWMKVLTFAQYLSLRLEETKHVYNDTTIYMMPLDTTPAPSIWHSEEGLLAGLIQQRLKHMKL